MSSLGTLHQYFKQPSASQSTGSQPETECILVDDLLQESDVVSSNGKRKGSLTSGDIGKRRKLSLSTLRAKQSSIPPLPPANVGSEAVQETSRLTNGCPKSPSQSVKVIPPCSKLIAGKTKKDVEVIPKESLPTVSSKMQGKETVPNNTIQLVSRSNLSASPKNIRDLPTEVKGIKIEDVSSLQNEKNKNSTYLALAQQSTSKPVDHNLKSRPLSVKNILSYSKATVFSSKNDVEVLPKNDLDKVSRKTKDKKIESELATQLDNRLKVCASAVKFDDSPIKVRRKSKGRASVLSDSEDEIDCSTEDVSQNGGRSKSPTVGVSEPSISKDQAADQDICTGRRSMRMRKPVARFTIDTSDREEEGKLSCNL
jgi:hypothetical protein